MASRTQRRFLERELPGLVEAGVVPPEVAERLRAHYAAADRSPAVPLFAVLGAALIGLGVILLLAANWEALTRPLRATLCIALLLAAQGIAAFALVRRPRSAAWGESTALGLALAAAAATALIAQTYQVQGDLRGFLSTWLLLCFPLPYLFDARGLAALLLFGAGAWLGLALEEHDSRHRFWLFVALLAPYLATLHRRPAGPLRSAFLVTVAAGVVAFGALAAFRLEHADALAVQAALVVSGIHALGAGGGRGSPLAPSAGLASTLAALAIAGALLGLGYPDAWTFVGRTLDAHPAGVIEPFGAAAVGLAFGALAAAATWRLLRGGDWPRALASGFPVVVIGGIVVVHATGDARVAGALASLWALALAIGTALAGMSAADLRRANAGLLLLAALVFTRFADWRLSFTLRGVVFIAFGVAFLLLNLHLRRQRRAVAPGGAPGGPT